MFLSCRHFIVNTTFSTGLVGVEVISVSWLGQLTVKFKSVIIVIVGFKNFVCCLELILEFKSLLWGEVGILAHFVLQ